jgi:hypothetical protein
MKSLIEQFFDLGGGLAAHGEHRDQAVDPLLDLFSRLAVLAH